MRVVFLDIDGVLNSRAYFLASDGATDDGIDPAAVARLNRLCEATDASIVVSSTWRLAGYEHVSRQLREAGVTAPVVGVTPQIWDSSRSCEIASWLDAYSESVESFVILDDDSDPGMLLSGAFVHTSFQTGLLDEHVDQAIEILADRPKDPPADDKQAKEYCEPRTQTGERKPAKLGLTEPGERPGASTSKSEGGNA